MAKALKMASVGPVMVTIRSGQFPSEMLILAPLCKEKGIPGAATARQATGCSLQHNPFPELDPQHPRAETQSALGAHCRLFPGHHMKTSHLILKTPTLAPWYFQP